MSIVADAARVLEELRDRPTISDPVERDRLLAALQVLQEATDYQLFGACASSQAEGLQGLVSYTQHFGTAIPAALIETLPALSGAVYLKFNPRSQRLHVDKYDGTYLGILVSFQSDIADGYNGTHGHFPLDLFAA
jgi:Domain of unknown function (DUF1824)